MKVLKVGDIIKSTSYVQMVNQAIGTHYQGLMSCGVDLKGNPGIMAWFVYMDGTAHGYEDDWWWKNFLTKDGNEILEYNVAQDKSKLIYKREKEGYKPFRLAFRRFGGYCCEFVGAFIFDGFLQNDYMGVKYKKVLDEFHIPSKGFFGDWITTKDDMLKDKRYLISVSDLNFNSGIKSKLEQFNIKTVRDLLEIQGQFKGVMAEEIRYHIYKVFE